MMKLFKPGQKVAVKDFSGAGEEITYAGLTVISRNGKTIKLDNNGDVFSLKLRKARDYEWAFYSRATMITPS